MMAGQAARSRLIPHQSDEARDLDSMLVVERYDLKLKGSSHDNIASQEQTLFRLLRKAWRYHNDSTQRTPVYLTQQTQGETNPRYALVYQCPELSSAGYFSYQFVANSLLLGIGLSIARFPWRTGIPGSLPTASTLAYLPANMPASPTMVHLGNGQGDLSSTQRYDTIWNYDDSAAAFSANFADSASWPLWSVSGSLPAVQDIVYFGSHVQINRAVMLDIATALVATGLTLALEYWTGAAWTALTQGTDFLIYPQSVLNNIYKSTGQWVITYQPPTDSATISINGNVRYYIRLRIAALTTWTTTPGTSTVASASPRSSAFTIPAAATKGDIPPLVNLRLHTPSGGDNSEGFGNTSRIILGAKSNPGDFSFNLILNSFVTIASGWTGVQLTDTSTATDVRGPRAVRSNCTFATDATMIARARLTGTNVLPDYLGKYRVFVRAQQIGGSVGDTQIKLVAFVHENFVYSPKFETPTVKLAAVAAGLEVVDLGQMSIPFSEAISTDVFTGGELYFELHAERTTGASTLRFYDLFLIPIDLWSVELDDPVSDVTGGATALRGGSVLDMDGGVLADRTVKYFKSGSTLYIASRWGRGGPSMKLDPATATYVCALMMSYPTTFGTPPFVAEMGMHLAVEVFVHNQYLGLRGSE